MRIYFKTLLIAAGLQMAGFILTYKLDAFIDTSGKSTIVPFYIGAVFMLCSLLAGIILPIRWCNTNRKRILTILLLPTNYTWLIIAIVFIAFVSGILEILTNLPSNFG